MRSGSSWGFDVGPSTGLTDRPWTSKADRLEHTGVKTDMDETHCGLAFEEALNILKLRTGTHGWKLYIMGLVEAGMTEVRCPDCGGGGRHIVRVLSSAEDAGPCVRCAGLGTTIAPIERKGK